MGVSSLSPARPSRFNGASLPGGSDRTRDVWLGRESLPLSALLVNFVRLSSRSGGASVRASLTLPVFRPSEPDS